MSDDARMFKLVPDGKEATEEVHGHGGSTEMVYYE